MRNRLILLAAAALVILGGPVLARAAGTTISSLPVFRYIGNTLTAEPRISGTKLNLPYLAGADCIGASATGTLVDATGSCGGDGSFTTTTINGVTDTSFTLTATSSGNTLSWSGLALTIPKNVGFFTNDAGYATRSSFSVSAPLTYSTSTGLFTLPQADGGNDGYLSSTDWTTFNGKVGSGDFGDLLGTSNQVVVSGGTGSVYGPSITLSLPQDIGTGSDVQFNNVTAGNGFSLSGAADGCATFSSTLIVSTGSPCGGSGGIASLNGLTDSDQYFATSSSGSGFDLTSSGGTHTLRIGTASGSATGLLTSADWSTFNGKQAAGNYITALTGDGTASGPGSAALTLATVNSNVGTFGSSSVIPSITVNAKGLVTAVSTSSLTVAPAGSAGNLQFNDGSALGATTTLTYATSSGRLGVGTTSPATTLDVNGTTTIRTGLIIGTLNGILKAVSGNVVTALIDLASDITGILGYANGGTGQSSWTKGDLLYASATNVLAKLGIGSTGNVLWVNSSGVPEWTATSSLGFGGGNASGTMQVFTASGTYTRPANLKYVIVEMVGGGGGGGGGYGSPANSKMGGGGGGGSYCRAIFAASAIGATTSVTVGNGGSRMTFGKLPSAGTTSTFLTANAPGGAGGAVSGGGATGRANGGAAPSGCDFGFPGKKGFRGGLITGWAGDGADSMFGYGGTANGSGSSPDAATGYGAGGGGSHQVSDTPPGNGNPGVVIVHEYY